MIWQASGIQRHFHRRRNLLERERLDVLNDLNIEVYNKEILALVGISGSGKSTLANIAMRLDKPTSGNLYLLGKSYHEYSDRRDFYRQIQIVFQHSPDSFNPSWTVRQVLAEPLSNLTNLPQAAYTKKMQQMLIDVQLPIELLDEFVIMLSGGQAQRINIARALISSPKFLILDEPTSNLDAQTQQKILEMLKKIQVDYGIAMLLISHDLRAVLEIADRVAFIDEGRIVEDVSVVQLGNATSNVAVKLLKASQM